MNLEELHRSQKNSYYAITKSDEPNTDAAAARAEALADARERRLLSITESAVYWGVIKASIALSVIAALAWVLIFKFVPAIS